MAASLPPDDPLLDFTSSLAPAHFAWLEAESRALPMAGIRLPTTMAVVLVQLSRMAPGTHQRILAAQAGIDPTVLARLLDRCESEGLAQRKLSHGDRRLKEVELLPAGRALADRIELDVTDPQGRSP